MSSAVTTKPRKVRSKVKFDLLLLPNELLIVVLSYLKDFKLLFYLMTSCRRIYNILQPTTDFGRFFWSQVRVNREFPDPMGLFSDYHVLKCYYGRGCSSCDKHPTTRKPIWEFNGIRLCPTCRREKLIRDYKFTPIEMRKSAALLSIHVEGSLYNPSYHMYLATDLESMCDPPTEDQIQKKRQRVRDLSAFYFRIGRFEVRMKQKRQEEIERAQGNRKEAVDLFLAATFAKLVPEVYPHISTYQTEVERTTGFTKLAQNKLRAQVEKQMPMLINQQHFIHLRDLDPTLCKFVSVQNDLPRELLSREEVYRYFEERIGRRKRWLNDYVVPCQPEHYNSIYKKVITWPIYGTARLEDEANFKQRVEVLKTQEHWLVKYKNSHAVKHHDIFKSGDKSRESELDAVYFHDVLNSQCPYDLRETLQSMDWYVNVTMDTLDDAREKTRELSRAYFIERCRMDLMELVHRYPNVELFYCRNCGYCSRRGANFQEISSHIRNGPCIWQNFKPLC